MKRAMTLMILILFVFSGLAILAPQGVISALSDESNRIMIQYKQGRKVNTEQALNQAGAQIHYTFDDLNAIAVTVPLSYLKVIAENPDVASFEEDARRYLLGQNDFTLDLGAFISADNPYENQVIPYGIDMVQARDVWDADRDGSIDLDAPTGEGITICIIDTGLYTEHEDLSGVNIIGGYDYIGSSPWDEDVVGHGTHVAGTITAMNNDIGVVGATPGTVNLYIVRVFNDQGNWIWISTLIDAADRCAQAGADIISMSLSGSTYSSLENTAFQNLYDEGILSIAAASNDGVSDYYYPASYDSVISVGALNSMMAWAEFSNFNDQVELAAPGVDVLSTVPFIEVNTVTVDGNTFDGIHLEKTGRGSEVGVLVDGGLCGSTNLDWTNKVVLCERGTYSFADKVMNVEDSGGVAALIYNNEPGNFSGTIDPSTSTIIGLSLTQEDGQDFVSNYLSQITTVVSQEPSTGSGYEAWAGTSMATPHVSGVAALVWSCDPSATNDEVRNALSSTALDLGLAGRDDYYGFGLVQAWDACYNLNPESVLRWKSYIPFLSINE